MPHRLDLATWNRRLHFDFFRSFDEPFFGVTSQVPCTGAYERCEAAGHSFFLYYLHATLSAVHEVTPFRYRIDAEGVMVHERVDASPTISRPDGTFGYAYVRYDADFEAFQATARAEVARVRAANDLHPSTSDDAVIHFSSLPWLNFTALSHPRPALTTAQAVPDSAPKVCFGKRHRAEGTLQMPVSVHVHHALMDGQHVAQFFEVLTERLQ